MKRVFVFCKPCRGDGKCLEGRCPDCDGRGLVEKRKDPFPWPKLDEQLIFIDRAMKGRNLDPRARAVADSSFFPVIRKSEPLAFQISSALREDQIAWTDIPTKEIPPLDGANPFSSEQMRIKRILQTAPTLTIVDEMGKDVEFEEFELGEDKEPDRKPLKSLSSNIRRRICLE